MSASPLRVAVVGLGDIAVRAHLPTLAARSDVAVVAVCDADPERLTAGPAAARRTTEAASIFADPDVDAVVIATPPSATPGLVRSALEAGKHVLAEKPLGRSAAEAAALRDAPGVLDRFQIGLTYRHHPAIERLRELVRSGSLGGPLFIQASICDEPANPAGDPVAHARRLRSLERLPPVISDGVHACDRINYLLGAAPVNVTGWSVRTEKAFASANVNGGALTYADGTVVRLEVVWMTPVLPASEFVVTGSRGRAVLVPPTFALSVDFADGRSEQHDPAGDKLTVCFALQLERFVEHCRSGTAPVPGFEDALASLELAERIAEAADVAPAVPA